MNQQQKKKISEKINSAKCIHVFILDEFNKNSTKDTFAELKRELAKNPAATLVLIR